VARAGRIIIIIIVVIIVIIVTRNRGFEGGAHLRRVVGIAFRADLSSGHRGSPITCNVAQDSGLPPGS